jgi:glutamyl-tRNA synthetase
MAWDEASVRERARRLALDNAVRHGSPPRPESVLGGLLGSDASLRPHRAEVLPVVQSVLEEVARLSPEERKAQLEAAGGPVGPSAARKEAEAKHAAEHGLPPLPGAIEGKVVLRLAPFPSGSLHIGHARGIFINDEYRRRYRGKFLLVFDDTVGSEEKRPVPESYDLILQDIASAGIKFDGIYYKSDRLDLYYRDVPRLLDQGSAYVCTCPAELLRENREVGRACAHRVAPPESQREGWDRMRAGGYGAGEAVVRIKTDIQHPNPAFRDRVLFRISDFDHPRVGTKYRVWPMLEYAFAIDDVELAITHVIRGKELIIEDMMEDALWKALGLQGPSFLHWGLLRIRETKVSKSGTYRNVMGGVYDGWSDPRTWSFASFLRRGIQLEAVRDFVLSFGLSQSDIEVPAEVLYAENRRLIDARALRRAFVAGAREVVVDGAPAARTVRLANHPELAEHGEREVRASDRFFLPGVDLEKNRGREIRLKDLMNVELPSDLPAQGPVRAKFTSLPNKPLPRIQWVPHEGALAISVLMVDGSRVEGMGEAALLTSKEKDLYQFERFGFVCGDARPKDPATPLPFVFAHP